MTRQEFEKVVRLRTKGAYEVVGEYQDLDTPIDIRHKVCDNIISLTPASFIQGYRCSHCLKNNKWSHNTFIDKVKEVSNDEYDVLSDYISSKHKVRLKHNVCGHEWDILPPSFLRGRRCPICANAARRKTQEEFEKEVKDAVGIEYLVLGEYKNQVTKITLQHNIPTCKFKWETTPNSFLTGHRCPKCSKCQKKDTASFKEEVKELVGDEYEVLGEYVNIRQKIKMKHCDCNLVWDVNPHNFLRGSRCPKCSKRKKNKLA